MVEFGSQITAPQGDDPGEVIVLGADGQSPSGGMKNLWDGFVFRPIITKLPSSNSISVTEEDPDHNAMDGGVSESTEYYYSVRSNPVITTTYDIGSISVDLMDRVVNLNGAENNESSTHFSYKMGTSLTMHQKQYILNLDESFKEEFMSGFELLFSEGMDFEISGTIKANGWRRRKNNSYDITVNGESATFTVTFQKGTPVSAIFSKSSLKGYAVRQSSSVTVYPYFVTNANVRLV